MKKASKPRHRIALYEYVYQTLAENEMIDTMCGHYFKTAQQHGEMVVLSLTLRELEELTGAVAAESNHARSRSMQDELGAICDELEECVGLVKRGEQAGEIVSYRQQEF